MKEELLCNFGEFNLKPEVMNEAHFPKSLKIYDTTLRDGEQTIGIAFDKEEKLEIAKLLDEMNVDRIEAGMPVVSKMDREAVELIVEANLKAEVWGFCRAVKGDIDACADAGVKHVICEIATSPYKMKAYNYTPEWVMETTVSSLQHAKSRGLYTAFFAVDATRADIGFLETIYRRAVEEGKADEVVIVDTVGAATPETMFYLTKKLKEWVAVPIMTHCHNSAGMATACTLFSVKAGADCAHVTVNGLGEATGNADIAELVAAAKLYGIDINIDPRKIYDVSKLVEKLTKIPISPLKAVVGDYVFKKESGVAVAQLITFPPAVELFSPELFGRKREVLLSKKSGKRSVEYKLEELNFKATEEQVNAILEKVKDLGAKKKGLVSEAEFITIAKQLIVK
jgi:isopropylmalate/homocitrate/citramalate synthase